MLLSKLSSDFQSFYLGKAVVLETGKNNKQTDKAVHNTYDSQISQVVTHRLSVEYGPHGMPHTHTHSSSSKCPGALTKPGNIPFPCCTNM